MDVTRIADLPENMVQSNGSMGEGLGKNNYTPINIHPNPYGNETPDIHSIPFPQKDHRESRSHDLGEPQQHHRLPSRDIPMDTTIYSQDEEIRANRIPSSKKQMKDYIKKYEEDSEVIIKEHEKGKYRKIIIDKIQSEFIVPFMVAILYFISMMSFISSIMYKYLEKLGIYNDDGSLNVYGMTFKSFLFGGIYWVFIHMVEFISTF
jgi:hypothetical protein